MANGKGFVISQIKQSPLSPIVYDSNGNPFVYFNNRGASYNSSASGAALGVDLGGGSYPNLTLYQARDDTSCPGIVFHADSASAANNDGLFFIDCVANDTGGNPTVYAAIAGAIGDSTNTQEDGYIYFDVMTNGTRLRKCRIDQDGLKFGYDTAAANALADYEEGTWTPTLSQGWTSPTYSAQNGYYTKVGDVVTAWFRLVVTGGTSTASGVELGGLPFTSTSSTNYRGSGSFSSFMTTGVSVTGGEGVMISVSTSTTVFQVREVDNTVNSDGSPNGFINGVAIYKTDA